MVVLPARLETCSKSWQILSDGVRPAADELNFGKKRVMITWVRPDSYGPLGFQPFS
jgi:hypothetical protein